jgi:RNA polymerase sigma factor (TIGR02999 family)
MCGRGYGPAAHLQGTGPTGGLDAYTSAIRSRIRSRICGIFEGRQAVPDITQILHAAAEGDARATEELLPLLYQELRSLAEVQMAKLPPGNTLQPTALVHEAYLRLIGPASTDPSWDSRAHFFGAAAQAMRDILVEQARSKGRLKRGGGAKRLDISPDEIADEMDTDEILAIHEALEVLEREDPRCARIVTLRYFGGLTEAETAACVGVSESTVVREWRYARSWLYRAITGFDSPAPRPSDHGHAG